MCPLYTYPAISVPDHCGQYHHPVTWASSLIQISLSSHIQAISETWKFYIFCFLTVHTGKLWFMFSSFCILITRTCFPLVLTSAGFFYSYLSKMINMQSIFFKDPFSNLSLWPCHLSQYMSLLAEQSLSNLACFTLKDSHYLCPSLNHLAFIKRLTSVFAHLTMPASITQCTFSNKLFFCFLSCCLSSCFFCTTVCLCLLYLV